ELRGGEPLFRRAQGDLRQSNGHVRFDSGFVLRSHGGELAAAEVELQQRDAHGPFRLLHGQLGNRGIVDVLPYRRRRAEHEAGKRKGGTKPPRSSGRGHAHHSPSLRRLASASSCAGISSVSASYAASALCPSPGSCAPGSGSPTSTSRYSPLADLAKTT